MSGGRKALPSGSKSAGIIEMYGKGGEARRTTAIVDQATQEYYYYDHEGGYHLLPKSHNPDGTPKGNTAGGGSASKHLFVGGFKEPPLTGGGKRKSKSQQDDDDDDASVYAPSNKASKNNSGSKSKPTAGGKKLLAIKDVPKPKPENVLGYRQSGRKNAVVIAVEDMVKALYARMERYPNEMREERLVYLSTKYEDISIDWYSAQSILEKSGTSVNNMPKTIKDFIETSAGYAFDVRVSAVPSEKAAATYKKAIVGLDKELEDIKEKYRIAVEEIKSKKELIQFYDKNKVSNKYASAKEVVDKFVREQIQEMLRRKAFASQEPANPNDDEEEEEEEEGGGGRKRENSDDDGNDDDEEEEEEEEEEDLEDLLSTPPNDPIIKQEEHDA